MSRPNDRTAEIAALGDIDHAAGEFWHSNPFAIIENGENLSAYERNRFYLNVNGKRFLDASFASEVDLDADSRSAIDADFDNDGDPDLLVASAGGGPVRIFENRFDQGNRFLNLKLQGTQSNRPAIGSRVTIKIGEQTIIRDLFPRNGCMGIGPAKLQIGVGKADKIDQLTVRWPTGKIQVIENVPTDQVLEIIEK